MAPTDSSNSTKDSTQPIVFADKLGKQVHLHSDQRLTILKDLNLALYPGQSTAITGRSGSGKTSLLTLLAGLDRDYTGRLSILNQNLSDLSEDKLAELRGTTLGFIFQSFHLLSSMTALENVALPLEVAGEHDALKRAEDWLNRVGMADRLHQSPMQLSGGEQQRVAIARAMVSDPSVVFADEPTGNLDGETGQGIAQMLFDQCAQKNATLLIVTHDLELAKCCDRQFSLEGGKLVEAVSQ